MTQAFIIDFAMESIKTTLLLSAPMLGFGLVTGLAVSIFQAVTQINEQTLAFIPKIMIIVGALVIFSPWMLDTLTTFTEELYISIPKVVMNR